MLGLNDNKVRAQPCSLYVELIRCRAVVRAETSAIPYHIHALPWESRIAELADSKMPR